MTMDELPFGYRRTAAGGLEEDPAQQAAIQTIRELAEQNKDARFIWARVRGRHGLAMEFSMVEAVMQWVLPPALKAALDHYQAALPGAKLPFLRGLAGAGAERVAAAVAILDDAARKGTPLGDWAVLDALGLRPPPDGASS